MKSRVFSTLYRDLYATFASEGRLVVADGYPEQILDVIDLTKGVQRPDGQNPGVMTVEPVARLLQKDIHAAGLSLLQLDDAELNLNGQRWKVTSWGHVPGPDGQESGELELKLMKRNDDDGD